MTSSWPTTWTEGTIGYEEVGRAIEALGTTWHTELTFDYECGGGTDVATQSKIPRLDLATLHGKGRSFVVEVRTWNGTHVTSFGSLVEWQGVKGQLHGSVSRRAFRLLIPSCRKREPGRLIKNSHRPALH